MQNQATTGAGKLLDFDRSAAIIAENSRYVAAGVNSNFRIGMAPGPLVFERGEGPYLFDANGNRLIDYYCGMGAMVLGHSPAGVRAAVKEQVDKGILFAGQTQVEFDAARLVCERIPSAERMRFGSSSVRPCPMQVRTSCACASSRLM